MSNGKMSNGKIEFPTLADAAIHEAGRSHYGRRSGVSKLLAKRIAAAHKFSLDDATSAFMSDLGNASYMLDLSGNDADHADVAKNISIIEQVRVAARAPFPLTWIEYNSRALMQRSLSAYPQIQRTAKLNNVNDVVAREGYLIRQIDNKVIASLVMGDDGEQFGKVFSLPLSFAWSVNDTPLNSPNYLGDIEKSSALFTVGLVGYETDKIRLEMTPGCQRKDYSITTLYNILNETTGNCRYLWALLAAINDVPTGIREVTAAHGYVSPFGKFRKFSDHKVVSLMIPKGRDPRKVARAVVAASRRRRHPVRGYFRMYQKGDPCAIHDFRPDLNDSGKLSCHVCGSYKRWIADHERGDASLGYVTHSYDVKKETEDGQRQQAVLH